MYGSRVRLEPRLHGDAVGCVKVVVVQVRIVESQEPNPKPRSGGGVSRIKPTPDHYSLLKSDFGAKVKVGAGRSLPVL